MSTAPLDDHVRSSGQSQSPGATRTLTWHTRGVHVVHAWRTRGMYVIDRS